jgi:2'-5' RNA ligase
MRIFIGIPVDSGLKEMLTQKQELIKPYLDRYRMIDQHNFHMTLVFIGDMNEEEINLLDRSLKGAMRDHHHFSITIDQLGYFKKSNDMIMWAGSSRKFILLQELFETILSTVKRCQLPVANETLQPHITLFRRAILSDISKIMKIQIQSYPLLVDQVHLYLSHQTDGQLTYTPIRTYRLH